MAGPIFRGENLSPNLQAHTHLYLYVNIRARNSGRLSQPIGVGALASPYLVTANLRQTLRLQPHLRHQHSHRAAKGRSERGGDGMRVRRAQIWRSRDPPLHPRGGPVRTYSGYRQPFPSYAVSPNVHVMRAKKNQQAAIPQWRGRYT